jgi:MFS family permease
MSVKTCSVSPSASASASALASALASPAARRGLYRRCLVVVACCQLFGGAGLAAGATVGALLARDMLGSETAAGLPAALLTFGSAVAAYAVGRVSQRSGRRIGLAMGFSIGAMGAGGVVVSAVIRSPALLFAALMVYGFGSATNLQSRYAGTDLAPRDSRARAVSLAMVSTTLGAMVGPNSTGLLGELATSIGIPALAGPFLLAAAAYASAGAVLFTFLRPDPLLIARALAEHDRATPPDVAAPSGRSAARGLGSRSGVAVGATTMVLAQMVMVAIMTMTPLHMRDHHHDLGDVGFVISMHIGAMFLPSLFTGHLVDRVGRLPMAITSAVTLLAAGGLAALAPGESMTLLTVALVLLGLGWNLGFMSGTALIVDATSPETRARTQGTTDVLAALAGASGGALSGVVVGISSYSTLALGGGLLALVLLPVVVGFRPLSGRPLDVDAHETTQAPLPSEA